MHGLWSRAPIHTGLITYDCEILRKAGILCDVGDIRSLHFGVVILSGSAFSLIIGGKSLSWVILLRMTVILRQMDLFLGLVCTVCKKSEHLIKLYG